MPEFTISYLGHATVLIEMDGVRLLTDPLLRSRVAHLRRRPARIDPELLENLDAVLISHVHNDHLDRRSLRRLGNHTRYIVPRGAAPVLHKLGIETVDEISEGESLQVGAVAVNAMPADHGTWRDRFGPPAEFLSYMFQGSSKLYFAGDTDLFAGMADFSADLDVALLPVWGWGPTLGPGHMDPQRAAEALKLLQPRIAIPIHWGTFHPWGFDLLMPGFLTDPPLHFAQFAHVLAPEVDVRIIQPGESLTADSK
ncbi:MAG: MBL fold metallo-hydrolase [Anaerolineae bacterium]|nr:MBL fold metallo-hydrolase [Anaerolineae bacterium]